MVKQLIIAGVDEAGRGPLAGPVVAAAVIIPVGQEVFAGIDDSKKIPMHKRAELFEKITNNYIYGVGIVDEQEIDRINILQATFKAMSSAIKSLAQRPDKCLIDGNKIIPALAIEQEAVIKGDSLIKEISAASIIAKVTRDKLMLEYHEKYPQYNFAENKGYGTAAHIEAILKYGRCPIHRRSFSVQQELTLF